MELECTMDEQDVIVLDTGSGFLKVGFSGEDAPRAVFSTAVATSIVDENREDEGQADPSAQKKSQLFFGDEAVAQVNANVTRPVQRGEVKMDSLSQDALESLWEYTFRNVLGVEQEELPVLIADSMSLGQSAYPARTWMAEVMFEKMKVKSLAIFNTAVLSLFSTGRTRGLVLECGDGLTQAVPVFEGYAIPHAIFKMEVAGAEITQQAAALMNRYMPSEHVSNTRIMQALKEKVCSISPDASYAISGPDPADEESRSFELPDGKIIEVPRAVRLGAPEVLFKTKGEPSVQKICMDAIMTCDVDFRQDLVKSLVVAGGTTLLPGLAPRLRTELSTLLPGELARQIDICVDSQRRHAAWIGGSMFASLSTFDQVVITKQEYEEGKGDVRNLVAKKTF